MINMEKSVAGSDANKAKETQLAAALWSLWCQATTKGFHGKISLEVVFQDGTAQVIHEQLQRKHI